MVQAGRWGVGLVLRKQQPWLGRVHGHSSPRHWLLMQLGLSAKGQCDLLVHSGRGEMQAVCQCEHTPQRNAVCRCKGTVPTQLPSRQCSPSGKHWVSVAQAVTLQQEATASTSTQSDNKVAEGSSLHLWFRLHSFTYTLPGQHVRSLAQNQRMQSQVLPPPPAPPRAAPLSLLQTSVATLPAVPSH